MYPESTGSKKEELYRFDINCTRLHKTPGALIEVDSIYERLSAIGEKHGVTIHELTDILYDIHMKAHPPNSAQLDKLDLVA